MRRTLPTREHERLMWAAGHQYVAGVDEVGRGCLAGPVTVAAVVLPTNCELTGVTDSKLLTPRQRHRSVAEIRRVAVAIGIGWAASSEIDALGLTAAQRLAGERALRQLRLSAIAVILDGTYNYLGGSWAVTTVARADQSCLAVAAASVVAKTARDRYMALVHRQFQEYGFASHKGYGSARHLQALRQHGATPYHRQSYRPVQQLAGVG